MPMEGENSRGVGLLSIQILIAIWNVHEDKPLLGNIFNPTQRTNEACLYNEKELFLQSNIPIGN